MHMISRDRFFWTTFYETDTETFLRDQILRNRNFFPRPNFQKWNPKPSKIKQKSRNREISKPKCQSLSWSPWPACTPASSPSSFKEMKMKKKSRLLLLPVTLASLFLFTSSLSLLSRFPTLLIWMTFCIFMSR